jgi:hypothetical protein
MPTFKPSFAAPVSITITLNSLASAATATSNAIDNSVNLHDESLLEIYIDGTAAANAWLDVRILTSIDGTNYGTWESAITLPAIPLAVDLQRYHARFQAPAYWKLAIKNNTGAALAASGNVASYQGVNMQAV